jgi:hypothetical protein
MDASAIMQNDVSLENLQAMTAAAVEYGVYRSPSSPSPKAAPEPVAPAAGLPAWATAGPGVCIPWEEKVRELPPIVGDAELPRRVWNDIEGLAYLYIWHLVLSF